MKSEESMDPPEFREKDPPPEESVQQEASDTQTETTDKTKRGSTAEHRWTPEQAELRSFLKRKCQHLVEGVPHQGDARLLHDIYTDLYITEGGRGGVNDEHEVRQIERASWREAAHDRLLHDTDIERDEDSDDLEGDEDSDDLEGDEDSDDIKRDQDSDDLEGEDDEHEVRQIERASWREAACGRPIKCSDIFTPLSGQHKRIRSVLMKGVAGIGKTVSVQKFILDWTEGETNQDICFIFPLPFRELNLMEKNAKVSLVELIQHFFTQMKKTPKILSSSEHKVLFIFDGLDECRLPLDFRSNPRCCDVTEPASVDVLLTNLIEGNLLPSALLWITTRPAAAGQIPPKCVDQVTEIRGFNYPQKKEYFKKRISDENLASRTITHLKSSRSLFIMCHIPVFCWILATVVERTSEKSERKEMPRTLTQMYTHFLIIQTCIKKQKYTERKERDEEMIFKLGKLSFQQLKKGNLIFYEEDLRECGIDVTEASVYSGVCTQIFREEAGLCHGRVFSFVHLSIQEFLAALYVFLCFSNRENMPEQQQTSQLSALFRAATLHDLHKTAVDLALQSKNGHLDLFLRFLLGLSLESNQNLLRHLLPQTSSQSQSSEQTVQYIKQEIKLQINSDRKINLFYCLNELNQHAVVEHIDRSSGALSVEMLLPGEWRTGEFKFKLSEEQLDGFDLQKYIKTPEEDLTELLSPDDVLQKLVPAVTSALLIGCFLTEKSCAALASAARSTSCSLKELNLSGNQLHDAGVQHLSDLIKDPQCKLETLVLRYCFLTEKSCAALASAARSTSCSLKELKLNHNQLHDAGVQHLSDLLKDPQCKLETLELAGCSLTEKSCAALASAARSTSCSLKELDLSDNQLHDAGVQHLSDLLKDPQCKLETLVLVKCSLTEKSYAALASAARSTSCSLKKLDLSYNQLHDAGVQHLSDLLKDPQCKLETLVLRGCFLTEKSCAALASAARSTSCSLKQLNLSYNQLHDAGVQHLSDLLKDPQCKLETLVVDDLGHIRTLRKESPAAAAAAASTSSSPSSDAAEHTHKEDHCSDDTQRGCESCAEVPDSSHWVLVEPEVSTEKSVSTYSLSSPAGSYECSVSGLCWSCAGPVTLQYRFMDWYIFAEELAHMQCSPAGPLMDIELVSGELEEIQLPHFLCLGGVEAPHGAVRLLHGSDSGVTLEKCEVTQRHARLLQPSLSLLGPVYYLLELLSPKAHCELLLFHDGTTAALKLRIYLVPSDQGHIQAIHRKEKEWMGMQIKKSSRVRPLRPRDTFRVRTSCPSEIDPEEIDLFPLSVGNFCEVYMQQPEQSFDVEVTSTQHTEPIRTVTIRSEDYRPPSASPGQHSTSLLSSVRPDLINRVSSAVLKDILDRLQAQNPPVLSSREAAEVLERNQVRQDQVSCLVDMVLKKGQRACGIVLDLLQQLDPHLCQDLHL
ncbi:hypothetical protein ACEWY4_026445 [Coilia grayii]|uniref:NACHT, LRR and PYD domains-containing protein 12-like n=1 Tax=Coilia grayii TaxID=363190 RepID=A0ABD1IWX9_9TELE